MYKTTCPALLRQDVSRQDVMSAWYLNNPARAPPHCWGNLTLSRLNQDSQEGLGWILGSISLQNGLLGVGMGCPGQWWIPHP